VARFVGALLGFLIVLEIGLRIVGPLSVGVQEQHNRMSLRDGAAIRILCVGESITAFGGKTSYPRLLQRLLNEGAGTRRYAVVNAARAGANTSSILRRIPAQIDRYRPDIVVAMMGINDTPLEDSRIGPADPGGLLGRSYALRRLELALRTWLSHPPGGTDDANAKTVRSPLPSSIEGLERRLAESPDGIVAGVLFHAYRRESADTAADRMVELVEVHRRHQSANASAIALEVSRVLFANKHSEQAIEILEHGRDAGSPVDDGWRELSRQYRLRVAALTKRGEVDAARQLAQRALEHAPRADSRRRSAFHAQLALAHQLAGSPDEAAHHRARSRSLQHANADTGTGENYRRLSETLGENGIILVAAQYPGRDVASLERMLVGVPGLILVDNESPFREAMGNGSYYDYFIDNFAGDIGHLNEQGRRIVARNTAKAIRDGT